MTPVGLGRFKESNRLCCGKTNPELGQERRSPLSRRSGSCWCWPSTGSWASRALGNYIGNCVATVVIGAWERDIDRERAHKVLDGEIDIDGAAIDLGLQPVPAE